MKTNRPWAKLGLIIASAVALSAAAMMPACGKLKSENVPGANEQSLTLDVVNAQQGSDGRYNIRANGRDTIEIVATVKGLSSLVGFYLPSGWGTFRGGTLSATDGFYYYPADRSGKARATLVAASGAAAGRIEMVARSLDVEKVLPLSFDFATLTILPPTMIISDTYHYTLNSRGGMPPIEWVVSDPGVLGYSAYGDNLDVYSLFDPNEFAGSNVVTVTARDAEGQVATATVTLQPKTTTTTCSASTITALPAAPAVVAGAATISVVVVDYSKWGAASVTVTVSGAANATFTLTQWGSSGVFQGNYIIAVPVATPYTFSYSGKGTDCLPKVVPATVTPV